MNAIHWYKVVYIAISWVSSPAIAGVLAFLLFISIKRTILGADQPLNASQQYIPIYLFLVSVILSFMTTLKCLHHFQMVLTSLEGFSLVFGTAFAVFALGLYAIKRLHRHLPAEVNRHEQFQLIEKKFSVLMGFTACAMVFAHGSNDVAITVGPVAGVIEQILTGQALQDNHLFLAIMFFGCLGVLLGFMMYGRKVIETVGMSITTLTPSRAFAATLAAASTVVVSTSTGIPVSATQTLVGAVLGVGLARGIDALNMNVIRNIFMSWIVTIPAAAGLATLFFYVLRAIFG